MLRRLGLLGLGLCMAFSAVAVADEPECQGGVCPVAAGMEKLPKMSYLVGEESTCCSMSANKLAEKSGQPIQFVVAEKTFEDEGEAMVALADETERFVNAFATPATCEVSGITSIAGQQLHCSEKAAHVAAVIKKAMDSVEMTYQVGEKTCHCPTEASTLAEKSGEKMTYVVGAQSTCCQIDARIKVAQAKYRAALEALAKMQPTDEDAVASLDS